MIPIEIIIIAELVISLTTPSLVNKLTPAVINIAPPLNKSKSPIIYRINL
jgi:hypothetical protein